MTAWRGPVLRGWAVVVGATVAGSVLLDHAGLPAPVLFAALLGGMLYALTTAAPLAIPERAFNGGQAVVGATIGALVSAPALQRLADDGLSIAAVTVGTIAISVVAGRLFALRRDVSTVTGAFALIAGGASGVVAVAQDLGADDRVVTIVQYLRVLVVLLIMPLVSAFVFAVPSADAPVGATTDLPTDLVYTAVSAVVGLLAARYARIPAGAVLGPLLVAVALSVSGALGTVAVPGPLQSLGFALIGVQVGLRFTRDSLRSIARMLPAATALILAVIAASAGMGLVLAATTGVDELTAYLATTPGGLYAVLAIAAGSGSDVTYVLAAQVIRVFAMLLAAPLLARLLRPGGGGGRGVVP